MERLTLFQTVIALALIVVVGGLMAYGTMPWEYGAGLLVAIAIGVGIINREAIRQLLRFPG